MVSLRTGTAGTGTAGDAVRLKVDPVACEGIGMCAHLAPGLVRLDSWGFPVIARPPAGSGSAGDRRAASAAVAGCPRRALFLE